MFNLSVFLKNRLITGVDGPYYLIQVRGLLTSGELIYGDPPLAFILLTPFCLLTGDLMLGVKIGVSFLCALSTIPAFYLMKKIGKGSLSGFIAMLLFIFSAPHIRMMTDFMKNAIGICFLLAFLYYLHGLAFTDSNKKKLIPAAAFLILTGLTHILDFGVALLFLALYALWTLLLGVNRRSFLKSLGALLLVTCIFVLIASTFFSPLFTDFNKGLSFLHDLFSPRRVKPPPLQGRPRPRPLVPPVPFTLPIVGGWKVILLILLSGVASSLYAWLRKDEEALLLLVSTTSMGVIISFPLIPPEWLGRFLLMFVVPTVIIMSYGLSRVCLHFHTLGGTLRYVAPIISMLGLAFFVIQASNVATRVHPTISYRGYLDLVDMKSWIPPNSIVVAEFPIGYWVQYVDEVDIGTFSPEIWETHQHVFAVYFKNKIPPAPSRIIYVGKVFILVELLPSPKR